MTDLENMINEVYESEVLEIFETVKADDRQIGFQLIGWSSVIEPDNRNSTNMSDGYVFGDKPSAEYYAALNGFHISNIKEVQNAKSLWIAYCDQDLKDQINGTNFCGKYWKNFLTPEKI